MVRIGTVWDNTTEVLAGRAGLLAPLAALAFFLPAVVQSAARIYGGQGSPGMAALLALFGLVVLLVSLWGQLAVIAVASDPRTTRSDAQRLALARLPANLLVLLVLVGLGFLVVLPIIGILAASGYDFMALGAYRGVGPMPAIAPGAAAVLGFYGLALLIGGLLLGARLFLVNAVVLNERRGIGAIGRSVQLTRGLTLKLVATALLFIIVFLVTALAAQSVVGLAFRLLLGPSNVPTARFMAAIAGAALTAAFTVVVQVFAARVYVAVGGGGSATEPA